MSIEQLKKVGEALQVGVDCAKYMQEDICTGEFAGKVLANVEMVQEGLDLIPSIIAEVEQLQAKVARWEAEVTGEEIERMKDVLSKSYCPGGICACTGLCNTLKAKAAIEAYRRGRHE